MNKNALKNNTNGQKIVKIDGCSVKLNFISNPNKAVKINDVKNMISRGFQLSEK